MVDCGINQLVSDVVFMAHGRASFVVGSSCFLCLLDSSLSIIF